MLDDSLTELLEASKTVSIYMRPGKNEGDKPVPRWRRGCYDCNCNLGSNMGQGNRYQTIFVAVVRPGADEEEILGSAAFVVCWDDRFWQEYFANLTDIDRDLFRYIKGNRGGYAFRLEWENQWNRNDSIYVRHVRKFDNVRSSHVNSRVRLTDIIPEQYMNEDYYLAIKNTSPYNYVGGYVRPDLSWEEVAQKGFSGYQEGDEEHIYVATRFEDDFARQFMRWQQRYNKRTFTKLQVEDDSGKGEVRKKEVKAPRFTWIETTPRPQRPDVRLTRQDAEAGFERGAADFRITRQDVEEAFDRATRTAAQFDPNMVPFDPTMEI